jgi:hypothetical protein
MAEALFFIGAVSLIVIFCVAVLAVAVRTDTNEAITYEEWLNGTK